MMIEGLTVVQAVGAALCTFVIGLTSCYIALIAWTHHKYDHLPAPKRESFFFGNMQDFRKTARLRHEKYTEDSTTIGKKLPAVILAEWFRLYGNTYVIFVLHIAMVVTMDPGLVRLLLVEGDQRKIPKSQVTNLRYLLGTRFLGDGLVSVLDHSSWYVRRKALDPVFHRKQLMLHVAAFNTSADNLMNELQMQMDSGNDLKMQSLLHKATLDVIMRVAFSMDSDNISSGFHNTVFDVIHTSFEAVDATVDSLMPAIDPWLLNYRFRVRKSVNALRRNGEAIIRSRMASVKAGDAVPDDILTIMVQTALERPDVYTMDVLLDEFVTFLVAGIETSANAMSLLLMELGRQPSMWQRLVDEVDAVIGRKPSVSFEELGELKFCGQLIKEALRMYPPVNGVLRQIQEETTYGHLRIPKNADILISIYGANRNPDLVDNPDVFDPDRFCATADKRSAVYSHMAFSLGPRNCIGQTFAQMEMKVIIAKLAQRFEYKLHSTEKFLIAQRATMSPMSELRCQLAARE